MSLCKLTVRFEDPFWVGLVEVQDGGDYSVAKHVFGAEPSTPEVYDFFLAHWNNQQKERDNERQLCRRARHVPAGMD